MIEILSNESFLALLGANVVAAAGMYVVYASGQLNLGQAGFFAIGAYTTAVTNAQLGWPILASSVAGAALAAVVALPVAAVSSRLEGIYLAAGTLAIGEVIRVAIGNVDALGAVEGYSGMEPLGLGAVWLMAAAVVLLAAAAMATTFGLRIRATRADPDAAAAAGVRTSLVRTLAVTAGAAVVAVGGGLFARTLLFIAPADFGLNLSFQIALFTLLGGAASIAGAILGAAGITAMLELLRRIDAITWVPADLGFLASWRFVVLGALVILVMALRPEGLVSRSLALRATRPARRLRRRRATAGPGDPGEVPPLERGTNETPVLSVAGVAHRFGGVEALAGVGLELREGEVVALIGANGAGKSTLVDVLAGRHRLQTGSIRLRGESIGGLSADARTRAGLSRTFQSVRTFADLTVGESITLGRLAASAAGRPVPPVAALMALVELDADPDRLAGSLTLLDQRRLELARALASSPVVVLLDEPSAGITDVERNGFATLIGRLRERGLALLVIDHNLDFALGVADRAVALDFGHVIAQSEPDRLFDDQRVSEAYLGVEPVDA